MLDYLPHQHSVQGDGMAVVHEVAAHEFDFAVSSLPSRVVEKILDKVNAGDEITFFGQSKSEIPGSAGHVRQTSRRRKIFFEGSDRMTES